LANVRKNDFLSGNSIHVGGWIRVSDHSIQFAATTRWHVVGRVFMEAVLVTVVGVAFAFAANQISPRGLALARNYFPTGTNDSVRTVASPAVSGDATGTNPAATSPAQLLAAQMRQKGLQLIDGRRAVQLFHDSHLKAGIVFIDARDEEHYQEGHIPGAYEFDPYHPEKYFSIVLPVCRAAEQIVVYCHGGNCDDSETAALLLRDLGIANGKIFIYAGGFTEWAQNRLPVETGARSSGTLHNASQ
jgi:rhodanese-related sulfurtransferase